MIWKRRSHITVKHLIFSLTDILIILLSITSPMP
jgi:hypothetical protein